MQGVMLHGQLFINSTDFEQYLAARLTGETQPAGVPLPLPGSNADTFRSGV